MSTETMHVVLDHHILQEALTHANSIIEKKTTIPVLSHILLEAKEASLKITATNLDMASVDTVMATVTTPGRTTVSLNTFHNIIKKLKSKTAVELLFMPENNRLRIRSGQAHYELPVLSADDFPTITHNALPHQFTMPMKELSKLLKSVEFAMSTEETTYYLNGIYLHIFDNKELRAVATDGHRLALAKSAVPTNIKDIPDVIIPKKTVDLISSHEKESLDNVTIHLSDRQISFEFKNTFLTSRLIDGTFPDYQKVIPQHEKEFIINMQEFSNVIERVAVVSEDKIGRSVKLELSENKILISGHYADTGNAQETMEIDYQGQPITFGFNARYLLNVASQFNKETEARFKFADESSPVIIYNNVDPSVLFVVMPMRV